MPQAVIESTRQFLTALFEHKPDNLKILVWTRQPDFNNPDPSDKKWRPQTKSLWASTLGEAFRHAENAPARWDVYACVGLSPKNYGDNKRCPRDEIAGIVGAWIDIDVGDAGHKKRGGQLPNPPDYETAESLLDKIGIKPSLVVRTGGGVHAYWLFQEPWIFETPAERAEAITILRGFQKTFMLLAQSRGFSIDGTHDLSRVLRVPGTVNWKLGPEKPRKCEIHYLGSERYDPADLRQFVSPEAEQDAKRVTVSAPPQADNRQYGFIINANAKPPFEKFDALGAAESRFVDSWNRTRKDLPDTSASGFDASLATFAARAQWSDQEIVDLLVASRVKHKDDLKRPDYYERTILLARRAANRGRAMESITEAAATVTPDKPAEPLDDEGRQIRLNDLSEAFGARIVRIIKFKQDPPKYRLVTSKSEIDLGTVDSLISQGAMRNALAASDGHYIPKFKNPDWDNIAQLLLHVCETVDTGPEGTDRGQMREWLNVYLDDFPPADLSQQSISNQIPFYRDEAPFVCIFLSHFRDWLYRRQGETKTSKALGVLFRGVNAEPESVSYTDPETSKTTTRNVWRVKVKADRMRRSEPAEPSSNGNGIHKAEPAERMENVPPFT